MVPNNRNCKSLPHILDIQKYMHKTSIYQYEIGAARFCKSLPHFLDVQKYMHKTSIYQHEIGAARFLV